MCVHVLNACDRVHICVASNYPLLAIKVFLVKNQTKVSPFLLTGWFLLVLKCWREGPCIESRYHTCIHNFFFFFFFFSIYLSYSIFICCRVIDLNDGFIYCHAMLLLAIGIYLFRLQYFNLLLCYRLKLRFYVILLLAISSWGKTRFSRVSCSEGILRWIRIFFFPGKAILLLRFISLIGSLCLTHESSRWCLLKSTTQSW